jgi:hypothetical protein
MRGHAWSLEDLARVGHRRRSSIFARPQRLQVAVKEPGRWSEAAPPSACLVNQQKGDAPGQLQPSYFAGPSFV